MAVKITKYMVKVDLTKLSTNQFRVRKPGTIHIGNRFIPFSGFAEFLPAIKNCNSDKTVNYVSYLFIALNASQGKKEIMEEVFSMPVFIIVRG